ncbi:MAG: hypothetical protein AAF754_02220 [Pseudomonadota bacterium]
MANPHTPTAANHFQQLRNRQNDLHRKNTQALLAAARAGDGDLVDKLRAERAKLGRNDKLIFDAELEFAASNLAQSVAEKRLIAQTQKANKMVKVVKKTAEVLASAAKMATILQRLIAIL